MPIHDMLVTEHWYIVQLGPIKVGGKEAGSQNHLLLLLCC